MAKFAIVIQAGESDPARALHGLLYAKELHQGGHEAKVVFDGAGTTWIAKMEDPAYDYAEVYRQVKEAGLISGACQYCSVAFGQEKAVETAGMTLLGEADGHPSLLSLVDEGYQVLVM